MMEALEEDFLAGLLDIPDQASKEPSPVPPPTPRTSKKRVALGDVDTNIEREAKQPKRKKRTTQKTKDKQDPTGVILDLAEFDEAQTTTKEEEMCKDLKLLLQTMTKVHTAIAALDAKIDGLTQKFAKHVEECGHQPSTDATSINEQIEPPPLPSAQPQLTPVFLPPLLQVFQPPQQFQAPEVLSPPPMQHPLPHGKSPFPDVPLPLPIADTNPKFTELPSSEINKTTLKRVPDILRKYPTLRTECKMSILAVKLAREAFFGDSILKRCTPRGWNDLPALPQVELNYLKATLFAQFPRFWTCPEDFEKKWTTAQESIAQACKRLRKL